MRRRAKKTDPAAQSLDSLLDTMANVVGILVVLVAVMQLTVGDAVDRIVEEGVREPATLPEVEKAEAAREELTTAVVAARGRLDALAPTEEREGILLEEAEILVEDLLELAGPEILEATRNEELQQRIRETTDSLARLEGELEDRRKRLARLDEILATAPPETRPKVARLPDPRPPPAQAEELVFFCRYGRVTGVDPEAMVARLHVGVEDALGEDRPLVEADRPWLENLFRKELFGWQNFYWKFRDRGERALFADMAWRDPEVGERVRDLALPGSHLEERVREHDPKKTYIRFWVWSDSFEVYLEARYLAEAAGFDVAWTVVPGEEEVGVNLLGGSRTRVMVD